MEHVYTSEKLNIWDRIFNRYKTIPIEEGVSNWQRVYADGSKILNSDYKRKWSKYHKVDRLTGGYTIHIDYLT